MSRLVVLETPIPRGTFRGFTVFEFQGHFYGLPADLVTIPPSEVERALSHPAAVSARSRGGLEELIDNYDPTPYLRESLGAFEDYDIIRHGGTFYGIPHQLGPIDPNLEDERTRDGIVRGDSPDEVIARIRANRGAFPIEFAGWLPVFARFGNCGSHPQFAHTQEPPRGYRFTHSRPRGVRSRRPRGPGVWTRLGRKLLAPFITVAMFLDTCRKCGIGRTLTVLIACFRLWLSLARTTGQLLPSLKFVHSRNFQSQVMVPRETKLIFITSVPYTFGQKPWVIEVEDSTSLFFPFVENGETYTGDATRWPCYPHVKAMLESPACRGIITHMRSTAESLPRLFRSEEIARKISYAPLGVRLPKRFQTHNDDTVNLLFTNSWHQHPHSFFLRGGLDVLEAFRILHARYPQVRLTLRSTIPRLEERYMRIIQDGWVRIIDTFLPAKRMDELQRDSHIFLLPAARIHIVSVLQAMSYGQAVVVSDGWGMDEYVTNGETGLVVKGRAGHVSWMDRDAGILREDYRPMYVPDRTVIDGLVESVSLLIEDRSLRKRLGRAARREVETTFNLATWNAALTTAFDRARHDLHR
jgi:glycosyltransferase involved in cell wall biosynthesis